MEKELKKSDKNSLEEKDTIALARLIGLLVKCICGIVKRCK